MPSFVVTVLALAGAGWDLSTRRVPNVFTFGAAALALVYFAVAGGTAGAAWSALGWATGLALFLPLFAVGALGAGDVKLLAAFGAWLGPSGALWSALWGALLGGVMALVVAAFNGYLRQALRNLFAILSVWRVLGPCRVAGLTLDDATGPRLAYAVPIAAGAMLTSLGLAGGAAGVHEKERRCGVLSNGLDDFVAIVLEELVDEKVAASDHRRFRAGMAGVALPN